MTLRIRLPLILFVVLALPVSGIACSCVWDSLKDRFRRAEAVFIGGLYDPDENEKPNIQNYRDGLPVLWVKRQWKGIHKELVAVDFDFPAEPFGNCPLLYRFEEEADYLVFAYGKDYRVIVECSDTQILTSTYNTVHKEISKLDSQWFRLKTRIWPF